MYLTEKLQQKWGPVLEHPELDPIKDNYRKAVTALLLENEETELRKARGEGYGMMTEAGEPTNYVNDFSAGVKGFDPVLISLVRRAMPQMIAYDVCGVQPMTGPTGLIFAMRSNYTNQSGAEALFNEADTTHSGTGTQTGTNPGLQSNSTQYTAGSGFSTVTGESLGAGDYLHANSSYTPADFAQMAFTIDKVTVTAKTRALKAEYSLELAQDLKAVHGLDAETELSNILSTEILSEINREVVRTIYNNASAGAASGTVTTAGTFDLDVDSNGRWSVEKFKGLMFQIEREANAIAKATRRGKGNMLITSSDVASALQMAGVLDYTPALNSNNLTVDDTQTTFAGVLNGSMKVYVDPYAPNATNNQYFVVGYKGSSPFDAGLFYCPYVPLQMVRAVGENTFQPKIGFKTRYGMVANPFATTAGDGALTYNTNVYYRRVKVTNLL